MLYDSNGTPIRGWDTAIEAETPQQRVRRRLQQKRCVACGARSLMYRQRLCTDCFERGDRYCSIGDHVVSVDAMRPNSGHCKAHRPYPPSGGREASIEGLKRGAKTQHDRAQARVAEIGHLYYERGWTWEEIARKYGLTVGGVTSAFYRNRKKATRDV